MNFLPEGILPTRKHLLAASLLGLLVGTGCGPVPALPANAKDLETFWAHTTWQFPKDAKVGVVPSSSRVRQAATSTNVGQVKVILGDSSNVSFATTSTGSGYGLRMDAGRQDLAALTAQVIAEEGDHFDFITVIPAFSDVLNPGFAYFSNIRNSDTGIGLPMVDQSQVFGSSGRLQGFLNMNSPSAYTALDGRPISDPESAIHGIMGQEMTHRWLAFARVWKDGFNGGQLSNALIGRDNAHWSALMHTGPANPEDPLFVSVQDGVAWADNGNGTFTVREVFSDAAFSISPLARFSSLDMYLMGLLPPEDVEPFFLVTGAHVGTEQIPPTARLERGLTLSGQREDFTVQHVVDALGVRMPPSATAQRHFNMAVVVLTAPGQGLSNVEEMVAQVDAFRQEWERRFSLWTGGRATLCTSLGGSCSPTFLQLDRITLTEDMPGGSIQPGERVRISARVHNTGPEVSGVVAVRLDAPEHTTVDAVQVALGNLAPDAFAQVDFMVTLDASHPCGVDLVLPLTLLERGDVVAVLPVARRVGVLDEVAWTMETDPGVRFNPDGVDTASRGRWALGVPQRTDLRRVQAQQLMMQPGNDSPDMGGMALFTDPGMPGLDPAAVEETDVDEGVTTVELPPIPLQGPVDPVLSYVRWHASVAVNFNTAHVAHAMGDDLVAQARVDDGAWVEIDRDGTNSFAWQRVELHLKDVAGLNLGGGSNLHIRFQVGDRGAEQNVVEAGVDDVHLADLVPACGGPVIGPVSSSSSSGPTSGNASSGPPPASSSQGGQAFPLGPCACAGVALPASPWAGVGLALWALARRRRGAAHC